MSSMPAAKLMTAEEYLARPEPWKSPRCQLVEGELVVHDPLISHQRAVSRVLFALQRWTETGPDRGEATLPLDVQVDDLNVYHPDVMWFDDDLASALIDRRPYPLPTIAVEVRSPSTWRYDIGAKKSRYEQYGLPELWLVDTVATVVLVFRRSTPDGAAFDVSLELAVNDTLASPLLPGFELPLRDIFR